MIGIVVVCHSRALAEAAVALATQMVPGERPRIAVAAGLDDGSFGTDAAAIALAIAAVDSPAGVLVLLDLGSALLSSELAVEFLDPDVAGRVRISPAPLAEGLLAAVVSAATGADLAEVDREARSALAAKTSHLDGSEPPAVSLDVPRPARPQSTTRRLVWRTTVRNPHGIHVRPAAAIVTTLQAWDAEVLLSNASTGRGPTTADSLSRITGLEIGVGQVLEARFAGPDASRARDALVDLAARDFGEDLSARIIRSPGPLPSSQPVVVSTEVPPAAERRAVIGPVARGTTRPSTANYRTLAPKDELVRFTDAVSQVDDFLARLDESGQSIPGIIEAQRLMLADRELNHAVVGRITAGFSAVDAVEQNLTEMARGFDQFADAYLRERGQDVRSLRRLMLLALTGQPLADQGSSEPRIWVVEELDTATAIRLDPRTCLGVITLVGGSSGHGMLTAQARGIPVLSGRADVAAVPDGQLIAFDPVTGELWTEPDAQLGVTLAGRNAARTAAAEQAQASALQPALTRAGRRIRVEANVSSLDDAAAAAREGAEGSGVVRTEVLFATATSAPTVDEQRQVFVRLGQALPGPLAIRTWDPAGDKPLGFLPQHFEENPALGVRGIRAMREVPELFRDQLRALLLAASEVEVRLLLPMVTCPDEVVWARRELEQVRAELDGPTIPVGMMVEVPGAALRAADFAGLIDFASIGTNDLCQYTQAADRSNASVRHLARQDAPAVLDLVRITSQALSQIPVAACGDLASDPLATATLVGLGITELSVRPRMVAEIKQAVRLV